MYKYLSISRLYSKAIFEISLEYNSMNYWQFALMFISEIIKKKCINNLLNNRLLNNEFVKILIKICDDYFDDFVKNFFIFLAKNKKVFLIPFICQEYIKLKNDYKLSTLTVNVVSFVVLTEYQKNNIIKILERYLLRKVKLCCIVDKDILGGLMIYIDDMLIDGSIQSNLIRFNNVLNLKKDI